ncbi:HD domain-containing protein [Oceanospirillum sediminis]|uniref:Bifunctional (P)ppGpp synthetase/guanosine-3',5'-bis(Diphosphate) 3'-pyrophosphohydrolase n=1 Tax=Oceanospirillum sediminis TaxID=2760088 RepID=A0A839IVR4_9GAMM|nr:HD domain-containing protein [Oceanospirillum sediminis]MBB1489523.1 bifunctional (p)ppGpp synthetase/guanosine-3',5'-bis(diphosphate) 3'-pyrophosphohydrolase [Oceanospirillum sediminis]
MSEADSALNHPLVIKARDFASDAHGRHGQIRRYTNEAYIVHPQAVVETVSRVLSEPEALAAAWLHDVVEDTDVELSDIELHFGEQVALLVDQLTTGPHSPHLSREQRKRKDRQQLGAACQIAKTIKLADIIDNTHTIADRDPEFAALYLPEKKSMLEVLVAGDPGLYAQAEAIIEEGLLLLDSLEQQSPYEDT